MSSPALTALWLLAFFLAFVVYVVSILWAAVDAHNRRKSGLVVALLVALFWPFGLLIWLLIRPRKKTYRNWNRAVQSRRRATQNFGAPVPRVMRSTNLPMSGMPISPPLSNSATLRTSKIERFCPECGGFLRHTAGQFSCLDCDYERET